MAWAFVQSANGRSTSGAKSLAFGSNNAAGNLIIVAIQRLCPYIAHKTLKQG